MVYKNGLRFSYSLQKNIDDQQQRVDNKKASLIIIEGGVGEGKTTLKTEVLDYINQKHELSKIKLGGPQDALGGEEFIEKLTQCYEKKLPCLGYDEAGDFSRRGSLTKFNATLNRAFEMYRAFRCVVVLTLPSLSVLDGQLFDNKIPRFGLTLRQRSNLYGNFEGRSLYRMNLLRYHMGREKLKEWAYKKVFPNFWGHFLDLDPERSAELEEVSLKNKIHSIKKTKAKVDGLLTVEELAQAVNKSRRWVGEMIRGNIIKPKTNVGARKYYDNDTLVELKDLAHQKDDMRKNVL